MRIIESMSKSKSKPLSRSNRKILTTGKNLLRILNATADGIMILDSAGFVLFANRAANQFFCKDDEDLTGTMFGCPVADGHKTELQLLSEQGVRTVEMHVSALEYGNAAAVVCLRDITRHIDMQETLRESNEALRLLNEELTLARDEAITQTKLKGQFVANISHEIRTPLTGIAGLADILLNDCNLDEESTENVRLILQSSNQLLVIVNDILDFSKLEAGHVTLNECAFRLDCLLEEIKDAVLPATYQKKVTVSTEISEDIPKSIVGDSQKLRQSLLNLAHNAVKFTADGHVRIVAELVQSSDSSVKIKFSVEDTGIGISKFAKEKIFQPFVQADGSTTRNYGGTGLGLSITKHFVELMNGQLKVESEPGNGSVFWFELDFKLPQHQAA
ncbi:MAG TPA: PAS domain-containing protein [Candidatus Melainabacteria bacterium]|nr:PAS domain-containing protein [Candidatus Melainabacteria bacterium]